MRDTGATRGGYAASTRRVAVDQWGSGSVGSGTVGSGGAMKRLILKMGKLAVQAARRDLRNRYELEHDWLFTFRVPCPAPYHGRHLELIPSPDGSSTLVRVIAPGDCNGATFVPDSPPGAIEAAILHDPFYVELREIAKAWGWSVHRTRRWGDRLFGAVHDYYARRAGRGRVWPAVYWRGVRVFGRPAHEIGRLARWIRRLFLLAAGVGLLCASGSGGCARPHGDEVDVPNDPEWVKTR